MNAIIRRKHETDASLSALHPVQNFIKTINEAAKTREAKRHTHSMPNCYFSPCYRMKKITLFLAALFMAIYAARAECDNTAVSANDDQFTLVLDSKGVPAVNVVGFCEASDYVIDTFVLAVSSEDKKTHLYLHELIAPNKAKGAPIGTGWLRFNEDLSGCTELPYAKPHGSCDQPGDFTRSVGTGSGLGGPSKPTATCAGFEYRICGHRDQVKYDAISPPPNK